MTFDILGAQKLHAYIPMGILQLTLVCHMCRTGATPTVVGLFRAPGVSFYKYVAGSPTTYAFDIDLVHETM